jgi:hypothetical protein
MQQQQVQHTAQGIWTEHYVVQPAPGKAPHHQLLLLLLLLLLALHLRCLCLLAQPAGREVAAAAAMHTPRV